MYSDDTPIERDKLQLMPSYLMQCTISLYACPISSELKSALWIQDTNPYNVALDDHIMDEL